MSSERLSQLRRDEAAQAQILDQAVAQAKDFLATLAQRPAVAPESVPGKLELGEAGPGAIGAMQHFAARHGAGLSGSAGPRYLGFVTGGSTPAALAADWLVSAFDQNAANAGGSCACAVELEAIDLLRQLFGLPETFGGAMVTGATMANFAGMAAGRQWLGKQAGVDIAEQGLAACPPIRVYAATPHASTIKAMAMLGLGRKSLRAVATLPGREAMDSQALAQAFGDDGPGLKLVVASGCTVNTGDFDDLEALAALCRAHGAWLHVDGAFGLFAACVDDLRHLVRGVELADSIASDGHKWLNVPYDCGFYFVRHAGLAEEVLRAQAAYLDPGASTVPDLFHRTPENSRRFRALPVWMTLHAYGKAGVREVVAGNCELARKLGLWIGESEHYELLAPVRLNVVCFARKQGGVEERQQLLRALERDGRVYLTPTTYGGRPGLRAAFSNWRTSEADLQLALEALRQMAGVS